jgi:hypothetical protein
MPLTAEEQKWYDAYFPKAERYAAALGIVSKIENSADKTGLSEALAYADSVMPPYDDVMYGLKLEIKKNKQ